MEEVLTQIQQQGMVVAPEVIAHLSPTRHEHINPHRRYLFDLELEVKQVSALHALRPG
jgi:hypothetical protein